MGECLACANNSRPSHGTPNNNGNDHFHRMYQCSPMAWTSRHRHTGGGGRRYSGGQAPGWPYRLPHVKLRIKFYYRHFYPTQFIFIFLYYFRYLMSSIWLVHVLFLSFPIFLFLVLVSVIQGQARNWASRICFSFAVATIKTVKPSICHGGIMAYSLRVRCGRELRLIVCVGCFRHRTKSIRAGYRQHKREEQKKILLLLLP